jgi:transposase
MPELSLVVTPSSDVYSFPIGGIGIIHHFLKRMRVSSVIDSCVLGGKNWQGSSVGTVTEVFLIYLLVNPRALYSAEDWVRRTPYLLTFYPDLRPNCLTDDRLGNVLDKLNAYGVEKLYSQISIEVIKEFKLKLDIIHFDLTNFGLYGDYKEDVQTPLTNSPPFKITYGFNKKGRSDLKQVALGVGVVGDGGVPIGFKTYDGNQADSETYLPFWKNIQQNLATSDFLYIGDSKLITLETMLGIHQGGGFFLAPAPRYAPVNEQLRAWLAQKPTFTALKPNKDGELMYKGFEQKSTITDPKTNESYDVRYFIIWSATLKYTKDQAIDNHIEKTIASLEALQKKINTYSLKSEEAIKAAINKILSKNQTKEFFDCQINTTTTTLTKQIGRGKPTPNTQYKEQIIATYSFTYQLEPQKVQDAKLLSPYYILLSNQMNEKLSLNKAFECYKEEYKVENVFRRMNNETFQTVPMYLQLEQRINAMLLLILIAVQAYTLIDREAAMAIDESKTPVTGLLPNKIQSFRPKTEQIIRAFDNIQLIVIKEQEDYKYFITSLSVLQKRLISILKVPSLFYNNKFVINLIQDSMSKFIET